MVKAKNSAQTKKRMAERQRFMEVLIGMTVFGLMLVVINIIIQDNKVVRGRYGLLETRYDRLTLHAQNLSSKLQEAYILSSELCSGDECLFRGGRYGIAVVNGYFQKIDRPANGNSTKSCNAFVITGGSEKLEQAFKELIRAGNTVNSLNALNQPVVNVDTSRLTQSEIKTLTSSSLGKEVELVLMRPIVEGRDVPPCFSFVDILQVREMSQLEDM